MGAQARFELTIGAAGFEPAASPTQTVHSSRLSYAPIGAV